MKSFIVLILFSALSANAALDECFRDAKTHGNHRIPLSPSPECIEIIKNDPETLSIKSFDGKYHIYGQKFMLYVEADGKRELLSGDQTELKEIQKIHLNLSKRKILILQKHSLATYSLDFIGNVSPSSLIKSNKLEDVLQISLLDNEDMIAVFFPQGIKLINSDGESRHENEKLKPKQLLEISGPSSLLSTPTDLEYDRKNKKVYVLDSKRLLVYSNTPNKDQKPLQVVDLKDVNSIHLANGILYQVSHDGKSSLITLPK